MRERGKCRIGERYEEVGAADTQGGRSVSWAYLLVSVEEEVSGGRLTSMRVESFDKSDKGRAFAELEDYLIVGWVVNDAHVYCRFGIGETKTGHFWPTFSADGL